VIRRRVAAWTVCNLMLRLIYDIGSFFFQLSLDLHYTEDEIYELSLAREPRNSLSSVSSRPLFTSLSF
jgi:hypothetical protein